MTTINISYSHSGASSWLTISLPHDDFSSNHCILLVICLTSSPSLDDGGFEAHDSPENWTNLWLCVEWKTGALCSQRTVVFMYCSVWIGAGLCNDRFHLSCLFCNKKTTKDPKKRVPRCRAMFAHAHAMAYAHRSGIFLFMTKNFNFHWTSLPSQKIRSGGRPSVSDSLDSRWTLGYGTAKKLRASHCAPIRIGRGSVFGAELEQQPVYK